MTTTLPRPLSPEPDQEWMTRAACRGYHNPEAFHPKPGEFATEARKVCSCCPVQAACLAAALDREQGSRFNRYGVWGNTTPNEREQIDRCLNGRCAHQPIWMPGSHEGTRRMTTHDLIAAATLAALAGLLAAAFAPAEWTALRGWWTARRLAARAWRDGTELVAGLAAAAAAGQQRTRCGRCRGTRCWYHVNGLDCPAQRAPRLTDTLGGTGRHEPLAAYRRNVDATWRPPRVAWSTLAERIGALPRVGVLP